MCVRENDGDAVEFGTTGYTMNNTFVLYDRASDSIWYPLGDNTFDAVAGARRGDSIPFAAKPDPMPLGDWLQEHPDSRILLPSEEDARMMRQMGRGAYLGVQLDQGDEGEGVVIADAVADGPAETAGMEGRRPHRPHRRSRDRLARRPSIGALAEYEPGDTVRVVVDRDGELIELEVELGRRGG